ncbi:MAG TPA: Holliday junction branch migration protein RuvA [Actinobacteria bacterium]|nr:Holliday junction branch migration protein RuvA [Actinomycetota bacterium]
MIASVAGEVVQVHLDSVVIEVGGVGMLLHCTPATLAQLRVGLHARLHSALVVREDSLTLYGFADADERQTFELLQTASGVGPKLALAMLAVHSPDQLRRAIAAADLSALTLVPGIGRKGAEKVVVELRDRIGDPTSVSGVGEAPTDAVAGVIDALTGLGWSTKEARAAVDAAAGSVAASAPVPELLRAALRELKR